MKKNSSNFTAIFKKISLAIDALSPSELLKLDDENYSIELKLIRVKTEIKKTFELSKTDSDYIISKLMNFESREVAASYLEINFKNRKTLEYLAKNLQIPFARQDRVEALRTKIVESTTGATLRSKAIQGN